MSETFQPLYAADAALTITNLTSLGNGTYVGSANVDNSTNLYEDALVSVIIKTGASGTAATGTCVVYAYGETDGSNYTDGVTGTDLTQNPTSPTNLRPIGVVNCVGNATTYYGGPFSVARAFGQMPKKWGIVIFNNTGGTLAASGSSANFMGVNGQATP